MNAFDVILVSTLFSGIAVAYKLLSRKKEKKTYRFAALLALATAFFVTWANLAVGVIGNEDNPINLLFFLVLVIGVIGASLSHFKPRGMSDTLIAMGSVQLLIPFIALIINRPNIDTADDLRGVAFIIIFNSIFSLLFAISALLFKRDTVISVKQNGK